MFEAKDKKKSPLRNYLVATRRVRVRLFIALRRMLLFSFIWYFTFLFLPADGNHNVSWNYDSYAMCSERLKDERERR